MRSDDEQENEIERLREENARLRTELEDTRAGAARRREYAAETEAQLVAANAVITTAITWLVTVKADQPASIIAHRADLALKTLQTYINGQPQ